MVGKFSKYNRFNYKPVDDLFTMRMGVAIPTRPIDVLPGDVWRIEQFPMARMLAMLSPAYGRVTLRAHTFFVPYRVIWPEFYEGFMIQKKNDDGTLADPSVMPTITKTWTSGTLGDYLGYPLDKEFTSDALWIRAYQKIIRDWYLNTNIEDEYDIGLSTQSGADTTTSTELFRVNYPRDYYTGVFPSRQRGEELPVPLAGTAPVSVHGFVKNTNEDARGLYLRSASANAGGGYQGTWIGQNVGSGGGLTVDLARNQSLTIGSVASSDRVNVPVGQPIALTPDKNYGSSGVVGEAYLSSAGSINPSDFRLVWQLNLKRQKDMYAGSRTVDWLREHYGVKCPDARLQRSEFLGGVKTSFNVSEVLQTSATEQGTTAQGNMAGHGYAVGANRPIRKTFTEHGVIMTIVSIVPQAVYGQGAPRFSLKRTPEEFGLPVLSHTIMDAVYKGQLFWTGTATDKEPLGYRNIYDEFRMMYSHTAGQFRPGKSLDYWTWSRKFENQPVLSKDFIQVENNERPFAAQDGSDHFLVKFTTKAKAYRKLPKIGTPLYLDHM